MPGFLLFFGFAQFEALSPLLLHKLGQENVGRFVAILFAINAVLGISFQTVTSFFLKKWSVRTVLAIGLFLLSFSFAAFALAGISFLAWGIGVVIFSLGEALALPAAEILIDEGAQPLEKAYVFAVAEVRQLGFSAGPALGGLFLASAFPQASFFQAAVILGATGIGLALTRNSAI